MLFSEENILIGFLSLMHFSQTPFFNFIFISHSLQIEQHLTEYDISCNSKERIQSYARSTCLSFVSSGASGIFSRFNPSVF
jgi:hypothetical protein